jgi:hypothetical protein
MGPGEDNPFFNLYVVQTDNEAHPASYQIVTGGSFPGGKADVKLRTHFQPVSR